MNQDTLCWRSKSKGEQLTPMETTVEALGLLARTDQLHFPGKSKKKLIKSQNSGIIFCGWHVMRDTPSGFSGSTPVFLSTGSPLLWKLALCCHVDKNVVGMGRDLHHLHSVVVSRLRKGKLPVTCNNLPGVVTRLISYCTTCLREEAKRFTIKKGATYQRLTTKKKMFEKVQEPV